MTECETCEFCLCEQCVTVVEPKEEEHGNVDQRQGQAAG